MGPGPSNTLLDPSHCITAESQSPNPYARLPSRRAIACVTCAKAKTKCNKAVPSCSRCITKGIMCEPRSTRRTSENVHRSNIRKPSTPLRKHHSLSTLSGLDQPNSPQSLQPSNEPGHIRSMSYDCYSACGTNQQALVLSGYPMLTPLPIHTPYTIDGSQSYSEDSEKDLTGLEQTMLRVNFSSLGGLSPPTPEPMVFHEPVPTVHCADYNPYPQSWYEDVSTSIEHEFGPPITDILPPQMWMMPNAASTMPAMGQASWPEPNLMFEQPQILTEPVSYYDDTGSFSDGQLSSDDCFSTLMPDWKIFESSDAELSTAVSTAFVSVMQSGWEDAFMCEQSSYRNF